MLRQKSYNTRAIYFTQKLRNQMTQLLNFPCTLVEAPLGYGKTTAVREYLKGTDAHVIWHRVYDNSVSGFWITFSRLFAELDPDRSKRLELLGFPNDSISMQEALKLIDGMELPVETVLVIDDYHLLSATEVSNFLRILVINEVEHLHIILTARFVELLSIEELSLKGYLYHISKEAFELMPDDIVEYYRMCGVTVPAREAQQLYRTTEGWISALYLLMLSANDTGRFVDTNNIQMLVKNAIYDPFSEEIKDFLLSVCPFGSFSLKQAVHMWGGEEAEMLLAKVWGENAFITFDAEAKTYQMHNIFTSFLRERLEMRDTAYQRALYKKAGCWCVQIGDYLSAMRYFHMAQDYESLLCAAELDKANSFGYEKKSLIIQYFEECPPEYKERHPIALLVYAMALMSFNEMALFQKTCLELAQLVQTGGLDDGCRDELAGELELLLSFAKYNDIMGMSEHHKRACALLKKPSGFMDTTGSWTFGSPSVLYMFYRESGKLEQEVREMKEAMPYYYRLTSGHGTGAEHLMEAERYFNTGDFENTEIAVHRALSEAERANQPNMILCAYFLQARMDLMRGDYRSVQDYSLKIHETVEKNRLYTLIHTVDLCTGFINACLKQKDQISEWLAMGDFSSSRLFFPARAFSNIIYGRTLLLRGDYLKLLGVSGQFFGIASVFPNVLPDIYTHIYIGAANEQIYRRGEAIASVRKALELAVPDHIYMPFVENCDYIKPLLEVLSNEGKYRKEISRILELYASWQKAMELISRTYFEEDKPKLSEREWEIARLAAEGFSNRQIGEKLFISENTVKKHLKGIFEKLGVTSRSLLWQHLESTN